MAALVLMPSCGQGDSRIEDVEGRPAIVETTVDEAVAPTESVADGDRVSALEELVRQLADGVEQLRQQSGYSAEVMLQERVEGELQEPHVVELVCRHEPFSTYLRWTDGPVGRELIYVAGENDDKVVVHPEGLRGRLVSRIALDQDSPLIMSERRYPISEFGLLKMNERLLGILSGYTTAHIDTTCERRVLDDAPYQTEFRVELAAAVADDVYRRVILLLDTDLSVAVRLNCYTWPDGDRVSDEETLIESYEYRSIDFEHTISDETFDPRNPDYRFSR